jgi:2-iminobutanoate/2-iminopropanoate deaminase
MDDHPLKRVPAGAVQHRTAGPYSPVIEVDARQLVVLSGQVAVDLEGRVVGTSIEEQTRSTLDNCRRQLASAGVGLRDVFKVNVYLVDLAEWSRFNAVYEAVIPHPLPVRTAVQAVLLPDFRVEIEMWAVKPGA